MASRRRAGGVRAKDVFEPDVLPAERRRATTAEFLGFVVAISQVAGALTLAVLSIQGVSTGNTTGDVAGTTLLFTGVVFAVLGVIIALFAWLSLRGSMGARFALVGGELVLGAVSLWLVSTVGELIAGSCVIVVLLVTVFSRIGRNRPA